MQKKWVESDKIRKELSKNGYTIEDTTSGPKISPVSAPFY
jgi:cysteinyl-tRNA synthetase